MPPSRRPRAQPIAGALPKAIELVLGSQIYIAKDGLPPGLRNRLLRLAAFQNPEFYQAQALRLSTYGTPRIVACAEDFPHHIGLPRGCLDEVLCMLGDLKIGTTIPTSAAAVGRSRRPSKGGCGPSNKRLPGLCWRMIPACWRPRPHSARR